MADSTSNLPQLAPGAVNQEARFNELVDALSPSSLFGRNAATTTGLTWGYLGGKISVNGVETNIANGTVAITTGTTRFVEVDAAGVVTANAARSANRAPLYTVVAGASTITSYTVERSRKAFSRLFYGQGTQAMADANQTITQALALCESLITTGALTAQRNLVVPLVRRSWVVFNNCTGFGVQVIGASGTGIVVGAGKRAIVESDGTNVNRVTADV